MISGALQTAAYALVGWRLVATGQWRSFPFLLALMVGWLIQAPMDWWANITPLEWAKHSWQPRETVIMAIVLAATVEVVWRYTSEAAERWALRIGALLLGGAVGFAAWHYNFGVTLTSHDPGFHGFLLARQAIWSGCAVAVLCTLIYMRIGSVWTIATPEVIAQVFGLILTVHAVVSSLEHVPGWYGFRLAYRAAIVASCLIAFATIDSRSDPAGAAGPPSALGPVPPRQDAHRIPTAVR